MRIWRLVHQRFADDPWDGRGAALHPGRWNLPGRPVTYCSSSAGLSALEIIAPHGVTAVLKPYRLFMADLPDAHIDEAPRLPADWHRYPHRSGLADSTHEWFESGKVAIRVPCRHIAGDNILLNPGHKDMGKITFHDDPQWINAALWEA